MRFWGIHTLFLLDAGLSNTDAFAASAFFSVGLVLFEVPAGVVADTRGGRMSYLLLALSTLAYLVMWQTHAPFWGWAIASACLALGWAVAIPFIGLAAREKSSGRCDSEGLSDARFAGFSATQPVFGPSKLR